MTRDRRPRLRQRDCDWVESCTCVWSSTPMAAGDSRVCQAALVVGEVVPHADGSKALSGALWRPTGGILNRTRIADVRASMERPPRTSHPNARDRQREETREQILRRVPPARIRVRWNDRDLRQVAKEASLGGGAAVYRHFPTKDALLSLLFVYADQV